MHAEPTTLGTIPANNTLFSLCSAVFLCYLTVALPLSVYSRYGLLLIGRVILGFGESQLLTGTLSWGFGLLAVGLLLYHRSSGFMNLGLTTLLPLLALACNARIASIRPHAGSRPSLRSVINLI